MYAFQSRRAICCRNKCMYAFLTPPPCARASVRQDGEASKKNPPVQTGTNPGARTTPVLAGKRQMPPASRRWLLKAEWSPRYGTLRLPLSCSQLRSLLNNEEIIKLTGARPAYCMFAGPRAVRTFSRGNTVPFVTRSSILPVGTRNGKFKRARVVWPTFNSADLATILDEIDAPVSKIDNAVRIIPARLRGVLRVFWIVVFPVDPTMRSTQDRQPEYESTEHRPKHSNLRSLGPPTNQISQPFERFVKTVRHFRVASRAYSESRQQE